MWAKWLHAEGQTDGLTDITNLIIVFRNFANAPKMVRILWNKKAHYWSHVCRPSQHTKSKFRSSKCSGTQCQRHREHSALSFRVQQSCTCMYVRVSGVYLQNIRWTNPGDHSMADLTLEHIQNHMDPLSFIKSFRSIRGNPGHVNILQRESPSLRTATLSGLTFTLLSFGVGSGYPFFFFFRIKAI
jgi:hypothetical protein